MVWSQVVDALTFLTRIPFPRPRSAPATQPDATFLCFAPLAGAVVAGIGSSVVAMTVAAHVSPATAALLTLAATIAATGALHEDGLADVADGFGGGRTRERKLEIMRDSRIGTYGALALGLGLLVRSSCLSALIAQGGPGRACSALFVAAAVSRAAMLVPLSRLPPARADGLARTMGGLSSRALGTAIALSLAVTALAAVAGPFTLWRIGVALAAAAVASRAVTSLARRQIGGVTGDVVGATQQVAEAAILVVLSAASSTP